MARPIASLLLALSLAIPWVPAGAEQVLNRGNIGLITSLDPHRITGTWENDVVGDLFEGLIAENDKAEPIPGQARRWEISGDRRVYTFYLRDDVRWSDGTPVTADDFEFAFKRLLSPASGFPYASQMYPISGAREYHSGRTSDPSLVGVIALDEKTLLIILSHPTSHFLTQLKHWSAYPLPRHIIQQHGNDWTEPGTLVSNGAFRLVSKSQPDGDRLVLERNPHYYDATAVELDRVVYTAEEDPVGGVARFRAGDFDIYPNFPADQYEALKDELGAQVQVHPYLGIYYFSLTMTKPPFDDARMRRAFALTVDREMIASTIRRTGEQPAYSFVPPGTLDYVPAELDFKAWTPRQRLDQARRLVAETGYGSYDKPLVFTLGYNTGEAHEQIAEAVASVWRQEFSAQVTLEETDAAQHFSRLQERVYEAGRAGWIADYNDAQNFLFLAEASAGALNYAAYSNADFDLLMEQAAGTPDKGARADLLQRAETMLLRDLPYVPVHYYVSQNLVSPAVKGFAGNLEDIHRSRWIGVTR